MNIFLFYHSNFCCVRTAEILGSSIYYISSIDFDKSNYGIVYARTWNRSRLNINYVDIYIVQLHVIDSFVKVQFE